VGSDKRTEILDAAIDLFSRKGFEGTSMRDLAVAVRLQPGSLYTHINGKDELLALVEGRVRAQFLETARPLLADTSVPVPERLATFLRRHLTIIAENLASATVFLHEWKFLEPTQLAVSRKERRAYVDAVTALIKEGIRNGDFRDVDASVTAQALVSMANGTYLWFSPDGRLPATTIADRFVDLVLNGLAVPPRPARARKATVR
jgi:AcrR family transcriptional regulator